MIIGAITEIGPAANPAHTDKNGAAMLHFYTETDAENWALMQSRNTIVEGYAIACLCTVINTDTNIKRWWYNGTEYTG